MMLLLRVWACPTGYWGGALIVLISGCPHLSMLATESVHLITPNFNDITTFMELYLLVNPMIAP